MSFVPSGRLALQVNKTQNLLHNLLVGSVITPSYYALAYPKLYPLIKNSDLPSYPSSIDYIFVKIYDFGSGDFLYIRDDELRFLYIVTNEYDFNDYRTEKFQLRDYDDLINLIIYQQRNLLIFFKNPK